MVKTQDEAIQLARKFAIEANKFFYVKKAILFGSYAKGTQQEWSDIAIISPDFRYLRDDLAMRYLFRLAATMTTEIEPVAISDEMEQEKPIGSLAYELARSGVVVFAGAHS